VKWSSEQLDAVLNRGHVKVHPENRTVKLLEKPRMKPVPKLVPKLVKKLPRDGSRLEIAMRRQMEEAGIETPDQQYLPIKGRKIRLDFAWPDRKIALEVDGAVHRIKKSFKGSFERNVMLLMAGWKVLHVGGDDVRNGRAIEWIKEVLR